MLDDSNYRLSHDVVICDVNCDVSAAYALDRQLILLVMHHL